MAEVESTNHQQMKASADLRPWFLAAVFVAVHLTGLNAPFIFDDITGIVFNKSIQSFATSFSPPGGEGLTVEGRPLLSFTFALSHAISGLDTWGYRIINIAIHVLNGLLIYFIVKSIYGKTGTTWLFGAENLAFATALFWGLHPLTTEPVVYISQRAESMATLFFLMAFCFHLQAIRHGRIWTALLAVVSLYFGILTKETLFAFFPIALIYDSLFESGSLRSALVSRPVLYLCYILGYGLLFGLMYFSADRGGTIGFDDPIGPTEYFLTQCWAITRYVWLCLCPYPLIFDYGMVTFDWPEVWLPMLCLTVAFAWAVYAFLKSNSFAFLPLAFFIYLGPTSSFVPVVTQTISEHRMYLPCVLVIHGVLIGFSLLLNHARRNRTAEPDAKTVNFAIIAIGLVLASLTVMRHWDYRTKTSIWQDVVEKWPQNDRAHQNLTIYLMQEDRLQDALIVAKQGLNVNPENAVIHNLKAMVHEQLGQVDSAIASYTEALNVKSNRDPRLSNFKSWNGYVARAKCYLHLGKPKLAIQDLMQSHQQRPDNPESIELLGMIHEGLAEFEPAEEYYSKLILLLKSPGAYCRRGFVHIRMKQFQASQKDFETALGINPSFAIAHLGLAYVAFETGDMVNARLNAQRAQELGAEIDAEFEKKLRPDS